MTENESVRYTSFLMGDMRLNIYQLHNNEIVSGECAIEKHS